MNKFKLVVAELGVNGREAAIRFSKMLFMGHCNFEKGSRNPPFQSTPLVGMERVTHKKRILCVRS